MEIDHDCLSRIAAYLEAITWSLLKHENLTTGNKILWKKGEIAPQKIGFDISSKLSPKKKMCMKSQNQFSEKKKRKLLKSRLLKILPSMQRVKGRAYTLVALN